MTTVRIEARGDYWELLGKKDELYGSIEQHEQGHFIVDWGAGNGHQRRFQTFAQAEFFVQQNEGDIADGEDA